MPTITSAFTCQAKGARSRGAVVEWGEEGVKRYLKEGRRRDLSDTGGSTQRHQQEQRLEPLYEEEAIKVAVG